MTKAAQKKNHANDEPLPTSDSMEFSIQSAVKVALSDLDTDRFSITYGEIEPGGGRKIGGNLTKVFPIKGYLNPDQTISFTLGGFPYEFAGTVDSTTLMQGHINSNPTGAKHGHNSDDGTWSAQAPRPEDT